MSVVDTNLHRPQLPTNRSREPSLFDRCSVGIDTIRVGGSATPEQMLDLPHGRYTRHVNQRTGELSDTLYKSHASLGSADLHVNVARGRDGLIFWYVEASVPRLLRGDNLSPATPPEVLSALSQLESAVVQQLGAVGAPANWRVYRLDVTRDFRDVTARALLLDGLAVLPVAHAKVRQQYRGPRGDTQTLRGGTPGRYMATLYDKHEECLARGNGVGQVAAAGHVRCEVSLRRPVLRDVGLTTVASVTATAIEQVARSYFRRCGYDRQVRGMSRAMMEVHLHMDDLSDSERRKIPKMLGILQMQAVGLDPMACSGTLKVHLDLARRLGLSAADFVNPGGHSLRLDFDSGTQVQG